MTVVFAGSYVHTLDGKGRTTLPARFRDAIPPGEFASILFLRADRNHRRLVAVPHSVLEEIAASERARIALDDNRVSTWESMAAPLVPVRIDPQGRFAIPAAVARDAGLSEGQVCFTGGLRVFFIQPATGDQDEPDQEETS